MLFSFSLILSLVTVISSQTTNNNPALGLADAEAQFTNAGLVPSLLKYFDPSSVLDCNYPGTGNIAMGQKFVKES